MTARTKPDAAPRAAPDKRDFGRKYELHVGQRYGRLLVTQTRPKLVLLCDCGKTVDDRTPSHIAANRLRSCGCGKSPRPARSPGDKHNEWTLVKLLEDGASTYLRLWSVECSCGYKASKYESDLKTNAVSCNACGYTRRAARTRQKHLDSQVAK